MKNVKKRLLTVLCMTSILTLTACNNKQEEHHMQANISQQLEETKAETEVFAMDTYMKLIAYGEKSEDAIQAATAEIQRLDALFSASNPESEVGKININGEGACSKDTAYLLQRSLELHQQTNGCFNILLYPIMEAWGFIDKNYTIPSDETLEELLSLTDIRKMHFDAAQNHVNFLEKGMKIGFGGIAKGYTSARMMEIFEEYDIPSAVVNLGGNVQVKGKKVDGTNWRIGVENPQNKEEMIGVLEVNDMAVITSGGYERFFEQDGEIYHHILDPKTGKTARSGLSSVTIVSADGTLADGLSTSLFVMGKDQAETYWKNHRDLFEAVLVEDDGTVYITEGLVNSFTPNEDVAKTVYVIE